MNYNQSPWKEVAWNGIRFLTPATWQVGTIGNYYLMLEQDGEPVVELKWGQTKDNFSHEAQLSRLSSLHKKGLEKTASECPIPKNWKEILGNYKTMAFSWKGKTMSGKGVILFCPSCHNATLIQFYRRSPAQPPEISQRLLSTFSDHREDKQVFWSVFGISATIPDAFRLQKYKFEAGEFELNFTSREQNIILQRWAPANVLLRNQSLVQIARSILNNPQGELLTEILTKDKAIEATCSLSSNQWAYRWLPLNKKPAYQELRLWHLDEKNCLLCVRIEGRKPSDRGFLKHICSGYECN